MENTYTILTEVQEDVEKKLNKCAKKAEKYNVPFSFDFGTPYTLEIPHEIDGQKYVNRYEVVDLTIISDVIKKDGYEVVASLEHAEEGNIVTTFTDLIRNEWVHTAPFCEHCHANHNLRHTFIVKKGDDEKQVGRTCLKDYCGIDPQKIGMINEFFEDMEEYTAERYDLESVPVVFDAEKALAIAIQINREQGYRKSDEPDSNKSLLSKALSGNTSVNENDMAKAKEMIEIIKNMSLDDAITNYLNNVQVRLQFEYAYCKHSDLGYFAFAPVAVEKYLERMEKQRQRDAERNAMSASSDYVGTIGQRTEFNIKEAKLLTSFENYYGVTFLYRFIDENDNVLVWFASSPLEDSSEVSKIKATVKDHSERDGVKQTIITRVKVA